LRIEIDIKEMKMENIIAHNHTVQLIERNKRNRHNSFVIWLTGLSGSGKSTLANEIEVELFEKGINTYILDGDNIRMGLSSDLDFTDEGRIENIRRIGEVAKLMADAGLVVITAFISPFRDDRRKAREIIGKNNFIEVFLDTPIDICEKRDTKGLYEKARKGEIKNFTGIDSPYEIPEKPDIIVLNHLEDDSSILEKVMEQVMKKI
jgi:adenylylsulfate kinase